MIYYQTQDRRKFFNFPRRTALDQRYIFVIKIDDRNFRRSSCPLPRNFVFDIPDHVVKDINANLCKLVFDYTFECYDCTHSNPNDLVSFFIKNTMTHFNLHKDQVILLVGNLKPYREVPFTVCTVNIIYTLIPPASDNFVDTQTKLIETKSIRDYKVLSLMRNPRYHRIKFAHDIFINNLRDDNLITCRHTIKDFNINFFDFFKDQSISKDFVNSLPWVYDYNEDVKVINLYLRSKTEEDLYLKSYVNFVIETFVDHTSKHNSEYELDMSEKVIKPISRMQPFIVLGHEGILSYLQDVGYKTFSRWWDESYDKDLSSENRYNHIFSLFKKINAMSREELADMLKEMQPILDHNRIIFNEQANSDNYLQEFKNKLEELFDKYN